MEKIKSFIYLDYEKTYSLSSQLFEGLIESFKNQTKETQTEEEKQNGPLFSGNNLSDLLSKEKSTIETKLLHDHIYSQFENKLILEKKVIEISNNNNNSSSLPVLTFVKVTGTASFKDSKITINSIAEFDKLTKAMANISISANDLNMNKQQKEKLINEFLKSQGTSLPKDYLDNLKYLIEYGYNDLFEIQIKIAENKYSAVINRDFLKEKDNLIINKYSRTTEVPITLFGIITQSKNYIPETNDSSESSDNITFKEATHSMIEMIQNIENSFIGKSKNETIIDPIALYVEL